MRRGTFNGALEFVFCCHLLWSLCSPLKRSFTSETPLEKTKFPFANGYPLEIASG